MISLVAAAIALGLAGAGHCVAMCGGVVGMLCAGTTRERANVRFIVLYNAGRIASYAVIGAIAGAIGASAAAFPLGDARIALRALAAIAALLFGLHLLGARIGRRLSTPFAGWIRPIAVKLLPLRVGWQALALGAVWGWVPCGMVYGATILAVATESAIGGALILAAFGLGTLPAMLALGTMATRIFSAGWLRRASGMALVLSSLWWSYSMICTMTQNLRNGDSEVPVCAGPAHRP